MPSLHRPCGSGNRKNRLVLGFQRNQILAIIRFIECGSGYPRLQQRGSFDALARLTESKLAGQENHFSPLKGAERFRAIYYKGSLLLRTMVFRRDRR